jgi:hypothetical protein
LINAKFSHTFLLDNRHFNNSSSNNSNHNYQNITKDNHRLRSPQFRGSHESRINNSGSNLSVSNNNNNNNNNNNFRRTSNERDFRRNEFPRRSPIDYRSQQTITNRPRSRSPLISPISIHSHHHSTSSRAKIYEPERSRERERERDREPIIRTPIRNKSIERFSNPPSVFNRIGSGSSSKANINPEAKKIHYRRLSPIRFESEPDLAIRSDRSSNRKHSVHDDPPSFSAPYKKIIADDIISTTSSTRSIRDKTPPAITLSHSDAKRLNIIVRTQDSFMENRPYNRSVTYNESENDRKAILEAIKSLENRQTELFAHCEGLKTTVESYSREILKLESLSLKQTQDINFLKQKLVNYN